MYKNVAPIDNPKTIIKVPSHLPKIKPPSKKTGDPNPNNKTQIIVPNRNKILDIKILLFLTCSNVSLLSLINS